MRRWINCHWFRYWFVAWTAQNHYLNQFWNTVNWTLSIKLQWNFNRNLYIFIQDNAFENVIWYMTAIFVLASMCKYYCHSVELVFNNSVQLKRTGCVNYLKVMMIQSHGFLACVKAIIYIWSPVFQICYPHHLPRRLLPVPSGRPTTKWLRYQDHTRMHCRIRSSL